AEAVMLAAAAMSIGVVATVLSTGLIARTAASGGLPMRFVVPVAELAVAAAVTFAVVALALMIPARRALRSPVRPSLAPEAQNPHAAGDGCAARERPACTVEGVTSALTTYLDGLTTALSTATAPERPDAVLLARGITGDVDV